MMLDAAYRINKIDVHALTAEEVQELYAADSRIVEKYGFLKRFRDAASYQDSFLSTFLEGDDALFALERNALICGMLSFVKSADWSGSEQYKLTIRLCERGWDASLLECLKLFIDERLAQYGEIAVVTYNHELEALIETYSRKVHLNAGAYTLQKDDVDIDMLSQSIAAYQAKNPDLHMVYTDVISEEHMEQYCNLFMETAADMPDEKEAGYVRYVITPEKRRELNAANIEEDFAHHCCMIFNADNEMIAQSNVSVNNGDPRFPYQFLIGVRRQYRGRSLGKWLYAAMYQRLAEQVAFEKVLVHHHPENAAAIHVSKWVGYQFAYLEVTHLIRK